mgnify:CR=1 FL=1
MKFQSFDDFKPINESTEKFKVKSVSPKNPNGEVAYLLKYIGPSFDKPTIDAFLKNNAETKAMMDKINQARDQYFIAYTTKKDGEDRIFSRNSTWVTFVELIDAKKDGKVAYSGFNNPPYNNFVDYKDLDKFLSPSLPANDSIIQVTKDTVNSVQQTAPAPVEQKPVETTPAPNAENTAATTPAAEVKPEEKHDASALEPLVHSYLGIKSGSKGDNVKSLQKAIEIIARAQNNDSALKLAGQSIRPNGTGDYDGIFGPHTAASLGEILGRTVQNTVDQPTLDSLKKLMADNNISAQTLAQMTPSQVASKDMFKNKSMTPKGISAKPGENVAKTKPVTQPGANVTKTTPAATTQPASNQGYASVDTRIGKIYYQ